MPVISLPVRWQVVDDTAERGIAALIQIDAWDPVAAAPVTLRAASMDTPKVCHAMGETWWPTIGTLPTLRYDLFDGAFGSQITAPSSTVKLQIEPWPDFGRYSFADARFRLWTGDPEDGSIWTLRFDGRVTEQPRIELGAAQIDFAVDDKWLDTPLLATYAGTTGAEGPAAMKGQTKPLSLGAPRYAAGKLIDSINTVFQVSAYGPIEGFEAALEKLARFNAPIANYATYATLVAATIPAGAWATANAVGMARFGAPTTGQVSFLVKGDNGGPNGWVRKPGQVIRRIALLSGGAGKIDDASLDALDAACPYNISIQQDDQTTARDLIQKIAASVNGVAGVSWLGKLFVVKIGLGSPTQTFAADGSSMPLVASVQQIAIAAPWKKLAIGAERAWTVHALTDIAFTAPLVDLGPYDPTKTYAEGNIVQDQGTNWLYINPTRTSGNAPPTLPTILNAWWRAALTSGVHVYTDATAPVGAKPGDIWAPVGAGVIYRWDAALPDWVPISDITAANQVKVEIITAVTVPANYLGVVAPSLFPIDAIPTVVRGSMDIRTLNTTTFAITTAGMTATVDNTNGSSDKGVVEITALTNLSSSFDLVATVNGIAQPAVTVTYTKSLSPPSPGGGPGSKIASDSTLNTLVSMTSYYQVSDTMTVTLATGERLVCTAPLDYRVSGTGGADRFVTALWQYSPAGAGTWTDIASGIAGSTAYAKDGVPGEPGPATPGFGAFNQAKSGLAAGDYDVRLMAKTDQSLRTITLIGTATVEAKV